MAQQPLTPEGGESEKLFTRLPRGEMARIDQAAQKKRLTRSQFVRLILLKAAHDEDQEVTASAS